SPIIHNTLELDLRRTYPTVSPVLSHYYQLDSRTVLQFVQQRDTTFSDHDPIRGTGGRPLQ
ncbi:MAG TPA: hypothetical protein VN833_07105, partial [Candidatus Acidoferrales bacterium]|nr:hypothetical protein [Candidatus Acidoferrales bacterium]